MRHFISSVGVVRDAAYRVTAIEAASDSVTQMPTVQCQALLCAMGSVFGEREGQYESEACISAPCWFDFSDFG